MSGSHASGSARTTALGLGGAAILAVACLGARAAPPALALVLAAAGGIALGAAGALLWGRSMARGLAAPSPREAPVGPRPRGEPGPSDQGPAPSLAPPPPVPPPALTPAPTAAMRSQVAQVAHDMSSPLATLKANLEWLRDALEHGRLDAPEEQAEARAVLRDAREATERLRADVGALREAGRGSRTPRS